MLKNPITVKLEFNLKPEFFSFLITEISVQEVQVDSSVSTKQSRLLTQNLLEALKFYLLARFYSKLNFLWLLLLFFLS